MDLENALINYVHNVQETTNEHFAKHYDNLIPDLIQIEGGRKYVKISKTTDGGRGQKSVHSFICTEDDARKGLREGDILKAASWKAPAKHARGNIFTKLNLTSRGGVPYLK